MGRNLLLTIVFSVVVALSAGSFLAYGHFFRNETNPYLRVGGVYVHARALHRGIVYWYAPEGILRDVAYAAFEMSPGWQDAGLDFIFTPDPKTADVCFDDDRESAPAPVCPHNRPIEVTPETTHAEDDACRVSGNGAFEALASIARRNGVADTLIRVFNHEAGHCLGLNDLRDDTYRETRLMYNKPDGLVIFPTRAEINLVKRAIEHEEEDWRTEQ